MVPATGINELANRMNGSVPSRYVSNDDGLPVYRYSGCDCGGLVRARERDRNIILGNANMQGMVSQKGWYRQLVVYDRLPTVTRVVILPVSFEVRVPTRAEFPTILTVFRAVVKII